MAEEITEITHFTHRHPLRLSAAVEAEANEICSGCGFEITGGSSTSAAAYECTKPSCGFVLHDTCFDLPRQIRHVGHHRKHPLTLLPVPPYDGREFTCDACGASGHVFTYHCGACGFDLHVECASAPETELREDHAHPLSLCFPKQDLENDDDGGEGEEEFECYVCRGVVYKRRFWFYYCFACHCGVHLECASKEMK